MEAQENKKQSLGEQGKEYLAQLEQEGEPYFKAEKEFYEKFVKLWNNAGSQKNELPKKKDNEPE